MTTTEADLSKPLFTARHHWINLLPVFFSSAALIFSVFALSYLVGRFGARVAEYIPLALIVLVILVLMGLALLILFGGLWVFQQNRLILTPQHIIQITQHGLFHRTESRLNLDDVQDVSGAKHGFLATIFNFGDVVVETAGEQQNFKFHQTPSPHNLAQKIMDVHREYALQSPNPAVRAAARDNN